MFNSSKSIEKMLIKANERLESAAAAWASKHTECAVEEFKDAHADMLRLERELAVSRNEPHAIPCDFPVKWDVGAPMPFLLRSEHRTYLTFYIREPDPGWDGTHVTIVDPSSDQEASLCLVTFERCCSAKLGHPNDEVQSGHPLSGRGLDGYTAQMVRNSPWVEEVSRTNSVHPNDNPDRWKKLNHYIFWFHDSTFECLAEGYDVEVTSESMPQLLTRVQAKLLG